MLGYMFQVTKGISFLTFNICYHDILMQDLLKFENQNHYVDHSLVISVFSLSFWFNDRPDTITRVCMIKKIRIEKTPKKLLFISVFYEMLGAYLLSNLILLAWIHLDWSSKEKSTKLLESGD